MYYSALRIIKTTFVTNIYFLSPFITFVFSWIILGNKIYLYYVIVAALVSVRLIIQKFDKKGGTYMASKKRSSAKQLFHDVTSAFISSSAPSIYDAIKSGGRVLAVKVDEEYYGTLTKLKRKINKEEKSILVYFNNEKKFINMEQDLFIKDIMNVKDNEMVVLSAGDTKSSENALSNITDSI